MFIINDFTKLNDIAAETGVISTLLYHPEYMMHSEFLKTNHFSQKENAAIYWAIQELYKKGITNIDSLNINNQLSSNEAVKKLMTKYNLTDINRYFEYSEIACRDTLDEYISLAKTIVTFAYRRDLWKKANEIQRKCFDDTLSLQDINNSTHKIINNLSEEFLFDSDIKTIGEVQDKLIDEIVSRQTDNGFGIKSKFEIYDKYFRYEPGELIVLASRMKSGKSAFIMNEAIHKAQQNIPTLVIDSEMDDRMWYIRVLAHVSKVSVRRIKDGNWSNDERTRIDNARKEIAKYPIVHRYMPVMNMDEVYSLCKILKYKMGLKFLCFDYIKANDVDSAALSNRMGAITDALKNEIAGELELCVLAACQLNRANEISSSDKIAMYASTIVRWRYKTSDEILNDGGLDYGNVYTRIDLNRNGEMQDIEEQMSIAFIGDVMTIRDCQQPASSNVPFNSD